MARQKLPRRECDIVMKGGVTSGIVYPPALLELQETYRFNSIGGTSAGAVAAAAAAAAEYGRQSGGFDRLREASDLFSEGLMDRFGPPPQTRPLVELARAFGMFGSPRGVKPGIPARAVAATGSLAAHNWRGFWPGALLGGLLGALVGLGIAALFTPPLTGTVFWVLLVPLAFVGALLVGVAGGLLDLLLRVVLREVPRNFYGVVNGHDPNPAPKRPALLTDMLADEIDRIAGLDGSSGLLTFGHLCSRVLEHENTVEQAGITLQMISTNLNQGIPYRLPFKQRVFLFKRADMERLFPERVVRHMVEHRYRSERLPDDLSDDPRSALLPPGYYFVPVADDFPVVVAMRMSLAIPFYFSAIPLYTIKPTAFEKVARTRLAEDDLQINLFSDGGITSNFPIHSFDRWLPTRPTFGITLAPMPAESLERVERDALYEAFISVVTGDETTGDEAGPVDPADLAEMAKEQIDQQQAAAAPTPPAPRPGPAPPAGRRGSVPAVELGRPGRVVTTEWHPVDSPFSLLERVVTTARENHDYLQSTLPGYRERIVKIRFNEDEGGMNLAMDRAAIEAIRQKGRQAGMELARGFNFDHHRWTRFLVLMSELEMQLNKMRSSLDRGEYDELLLERVGTQTQDVSQDFPYMDHHGRAWRRRALQCAQSLVDVLDTWEQIEAGQQYEPLRNPQDGDEAAPPELPEPPAERRVPDCDPHAAPLTTHLFNGKPGERDYTPRPRPVLRVTPDF
jgi:predicted acylesterase/phospholipase RssA